LPSDSAGFLLSLFFYPEDGGDIFHRNVDETSGLCMAPALTLVSYSAYFSTLKMETIYSTETSMKLQGSAWHLLSRWFLTQLIFLP
jgi:hypothetical protein